MESLVGRIYQIAQGVHSRLLLKYPDARSTILFHPVRQLNGRGLVLPVLVFSFPSVKSLSIQYKFTPQELGSAGERKDGIDRLILELTSFFSRGVESQCEDESK
jgi:hypothetical protein